MSPPLASCASLSSLKRRGVIVLTSKNYCKNHMKKCIYVGALDQVCFQVHAFLVSVPTFTKQMFPSKTNVPHRLGTEPVSKQVLLCECSYCRHFRGQNDGKESAETTEKSLLHEEPRTAQRPCAAATAGLGNPCDPSTRQTEGTLLNILPTHFLENDLKTHQHAGCLFWKGSLLPFRLALTVTQTTLWWKQPHHGGMGLGELLECREDYMETPTGPGKKPGCVSSSNRRVPALRRSPALPTHSKRLESLKSPELHCRGRR